MNSISVQELLDLNETIAFGIFEGIDKPWEVLSKIHDYILELGESLPSSDFDQVGEDIWISKTAQIAATACLNGPIIIDADAEIRHCAYIRGNAIIGRGAIVGNSTEIKNAILFNNVQVPHFNYVGDSILGYKAHMGAGAVTSNVKSDMSLVVVRDADAEYETGLIKMGAILGDNVEVGCNSVLNPGTVIGRSGQIYPTSCVRGVIPADSIFKGKGNIVHRT